MKYKLQEYWYLGFLSLIGIPNFIFFVQGEPYTYLGFLWFLWLFEFFPADEKNGTRSI